MDELIKILLTYGPGAVLAVLVITGVLIPKAFYDREVKRGDTATEAASKNADALKTVTEAIKELAASLKELQVQITANHEAIEESEKRIEALREDVRVLLRGGVK